MKLSGILGPTPRSLERVHKGSVVLWPRAKDVSIIEWRTCGGGKVVASPVFTIPKRCKDHVKAICHMHGSRGLGWHGLIHSLK